MGKAINRSDVNLDRVSEQPSVTCAGAWLMLRQLSDEIGCVQLGVAIVYAYWYFDRTIEDAIRHDTGNNKRDCFFRTTALER